MTYPPHHKENLEIGTIFIDSDEEFMIVTDISKKEVTLRVLASPLRVDHTICDVALDPFTTHLRVLASPLRVDHSRIGIAYTYQYLRDDFIVKIIA